ncbi:MAG: translation initiation factor IF-2 [bacterium]|nr:translation initiation factor IF-2 [bacterium]
MTDQSVQTIAIPQRIIVKELAMKMNKPVTEVISLLMQNGVMSSLNEWIDFETAAVIASDLGFDAVEQAESEESDAARELIEKQSTPKKLEPRPPVVVVMGHVDHGKTKLLDAIRETNVVDSEAGGITQHIGAYQAKEKNRLMTFIDTPGHEAFSAMRSRGAKIADVAILVVAADDSVKPQTQEAITIIQKANLPMIVAINKVDLAEAQPQKVKQDLAQYNVLVEGWGGNVPVAEISAKEKQGITELLDLVLLVADMNKQRIMADPSQAPVGTIIESHIDKGKGPLATVIVQTGTLRKDDLVTVGGVVGGKIRAMRDHLGQIVSEALPSQPVEISGLERAASVGDIMTIITKAELAKMKKLKEFKPSAPTVHIIKKEVEEQEENSVGQVKKLNLVLKADALGSLEAIIQSLEKIESDEVRVDIVAKGLGNVTEADVQRAIASEAILYGFNVKATPSALEVAKGQDFTIRTATVIYDLIGEVFNELEQLLTPEIIRAELGELKVLAVFRTKLPNVIAGGQVTKGQMKNGAQFEIVRNNAVMGRGTVEQVQMEKRAVDSAPAGKECGLKLKVDAGLEVGDVLKAFTEETKKKILKRP